jgi:hypothetical protein
VVICSRDGFADLARAIASIRHAMRSAKSELVVVEESDSPREIRASGMCISRGKAGGSATRETPGCGRRGAR